MNATSNSSPGGNDIDEVLAVDAATSSWMVTDSPQSDDNEAAINANDESSLSPNDGPNSTPPNNDDPAESDRCKHVVSRYVYECIRPPSLKGSTNFLLFISIVRKI